ncbi:proline-rich transmembrane protein 4-like [Ptychodera flava]|uniref:proline-rich transmembrane protein 4-like n=1 Tax=Ptychodera flava TaxID=63121 RepID=UPI00396A21FD
MSLAREKDLTTERLVTVIYLTAFCFSATPGEGLAPTGPVPETLEPKVVNTSAAHTTAQSVDGSAAEPEGEPEPSHVKNGTTDVTEVISSTATSGGTTNVNPCHHLNATSQSDGQDWPLPLCNTSHVKTTTTNTITLTAQPENNTPSSEMEAEPEVNPETGPESEGTVSAEPESYPEDGAGDVIGIAAEPAPEWNQAFETWSNAWGIHVYGFGTLHAILAIACLWTLIRSYRRKEDSVAYCTCIRILLLTFGVTRCLCLYTDAYNAYNILPSLAYTLIWIVGEPCFLASFTIYFLVLQEATQFRPGRRRFRVNQGKFLFGVVCIHFVFAVLSPVVLYYTVRVGTVLQIICGSYYLVIGAGATACFAFLGKKLHGPFQRMKTGKIQKTTLNRDKKVLWRILTHVYLLVMSGILICVIHLYGMLGVYGVLAKGTDNSYVKPWPWWVFQTVARILELTVAFVLFRAVNNNQKTKQKVQDVKGRLDSINANTTSLTCRDETMKVSVSDSTQVAKTEVNGSGYHGKAGSSGEECHMESTHSQTGDDGKPIFGHADVMV